MEAPLAPEGAVSLVVIKHLNLSQVGPPQSSKYLQLPEHFFIYGFNFLLFLLLLSKCSTADLLPAIK